MSKAALRRGLRRTLKALPSAVVASQSADVCAVVADTAAFKASKSVSVYLAMEGRELQTLPLIEQCFKDRKRVFVPKVTGPSRHDMVMVEVDSMDDLRAFPVSDWGIPEPADVAHRAHCTDPAHPVDLVLVPALAFSTECRRLGHGCGYYDTFFAGMHAAYSAAGVPFPHLLGLALDVQITGVPVDEHDWVLDAVVAPGATYTAKAGVVGRPGK